MSGASHAGTALTYSEPVLRFNPRALVPVALLFGVELLIALYVRDAIVRPYGGDVLAAVFVYAVLRVVLTVRSRTLALAAFGIGAAVEFSQWLRIPAHLGLERLPALAVAAGTTFEWLDLGCYALGATAAWVVDERTRAFRARPV